MRKGERTNGGVGREASVFSGVEKKEWRGRSESERVCVFSVCLSNGEGGNAAEE